MIDPNLQAELRARFNPDGSELRNMQLRMLDMLKYIDNICRENNIKYWLSSGTCLGAIRHGGFIPWDDDCDIELPKRDFLKLCNILRHEDHEYSLQNHYTDTEYVAPYPKLRDRHSYLKETNDNDSKYKYHGIYVDIFCIEPSSSKKLCKFSYILQSFFIYPLSRIRNKPIRTNSKKLVVPFFQKCIYPIFSLVGKINNNGWYRHIPGSGFLKRRFEKDFEEIVYTKFEDCYLPVPKFAEKYLERIYGQFDELPNIDSIHHHITKVEFL